MKSCERAFFFKKNFVKKKNGDVIEDRGLIYPNRSHFQSVRALSCVPVLCTHGSEMLMGRTSWYSKISGTLYFRDVHMYVFLEWYLRCKRAGGGGRGGTRFHRIC